MHTDKYIWLGRNPDSKSDWAKHLEGYCSQTAIELKPKILDSQPLKICPEIQITCDLVCSSIHSSAKCQCYCLGRSIASGDLSGTSSCSAPPARLRSRRDTENLSSSFLISYTPGTCLDFEFQGEVSNRHRHCHCHHYRCQSHHNQDNHYHHHHTWSVML